MKTIRIEAVASGKQYEVSDGQWLDMKQTGRAKKFREVPEKKITRPALTTPKDEQPADNIEH